ncbi:NUDIX hydrolase [Aestuariicoccus sp. MJ-SS9]|uniref:NUDIX hydrolase n=1 Tax=Aestuariicoccus sp. MJ-SS9 TaxID=3079855 RepID=UPI002912C48E|nr:NUDIX domain-containing protein [Aestuariicoccus sp. MJ-SS9]MDU8910464.1 NUDIX domain-containing protein [Aestuariicoccus sp. MJ-SS9]
MKAPENLAWQIAALPVRRDRKGRLRVLMVTTRESGRWVMPKGWPMDGKKPWRAAEIEALEEAGAVGAVSHRPLGTYHYAKRLPNGRRLRCRVTVYAMDVQKLKRRWKERKARKRHWFSPRKAAALVREKELAALLRGLDRKADRKPVWPVLKKAS